jgi:hypothetical protein
MVIIIQTIYFHLFPSLFTSEPNEICWKFFLFSMKSGRGYSTHSDTHNCAQHASIIGGTQQISELLGNQIRKYKNCKIILNAHVCNLKIIATVNNILI